MHVDALRCVGRRVRQHRAGMIAASQSRLRKKPVAVGFYPYPSWRTHEQKHHPSRGISILVKLSISIWPNESTVSLRDSGRSHGTSVRRSIGSRELHRQNIFSSRPTEKSGQTSSVPFRDDFLPWLKGIPKGFERFLYPFDAADRNFSSSFRG
jgi:hypothetical protein